MISSITAAVVILMLDPSFQELETEKFVQLDT